MDLAHGGRIGQIISGADNSFDRAVVADSFSGLLERIIALLEHCVNNRSFESDESDESAIEDCLSEHLYDLVLSPLQSTVVDGTALGSCFVRGGSKRLVLKNAKDCKAIDMAADICLLPNLAIMPSLLMRSEFSHYRIDYR